jgi:tRNA-2-methylthio-N6-dimethylallyladenosine synthase
MKNQVEEAAKDERLQRLQALLMDQQAAFAAGLVGSTIEALIEKPGRQAGQIVGRSPWLQPVILDEKAGKIGDIIQVRIMRSGHASLFAELA